MCSDQANHSLHCLDGLVELKAYAGENQFYRHEPIRVAANIRHFEHADGTPFPWTHGIWACANVRAVTMQSRRTLTRSAELRAETLTLSLLRRERGTFGGTVSGSPSRDPRQVRAGSPLPARSGERIKVRGASDNILTTELAGGIQEFERNHFEPFRGAMHPIIRLTSGMSGEGSSVRLSKDLE
jgi:hypothetical protein